MAAGAGAGGGAVDRPPPFPEHPFVDEDAEDAEDAAAPQAQVAGGVKDPFLNRAIEMSGKHREGIDVGVLAVITAGERAIEPGLHRLADQRDQAELQWLVPPNKTRVQAPQWALVQGGQGRPRTTVPHEPAGKAECRR